MCFSATASFAASGVLATTGVVALSQLRNKKDIMLATIPMIFALQQLIEGFLWLNLGTGNVMETLGKQGFLFFALFWWPAFIPWVCFSIEKEKAKRKMMLVLFAIGFLIGVFLYIRALTLPAMVEVKNLCLSYSLDLFWPNLFSIGYIGVVVFSFFVSSEKFLKWFGAVILFAAMTAWMFFEFAFVSVWCFFSAVLSVLICIYLIRKKKKYAVIKRGL